MPTTYAIPNGATQFAATLWSGNNSTQSIVNGASTSGTSFQPDLVWLKQRSPTGTGHILEDSVRGALKYLGSESTAGESTIAGTVTSFNSNGFSIGSQAGTNATGSTYVGWQWKASNAVAVTNTAGTISSQVSVNPTAGFSIVTYTGNLTTTPSAGLMPTVGHGLTSAPKLIISKSTNVVGVDSGAWAVFSSSIATDSYLRLNTPAGTASISGGGGGTMVAPTNSVFSTPYISGSNVNANNYVAYCWSEIDGFSKFGSYTGATGLPFVYLGFRPRWIMIKRTDAASTIGWVIWDTTRGSSSGGNVVGYQLYPNSATTESSSSTSIDILSNGFKFRDTYQDWNANNGGYIYAAFAENPFKYANAR